MGHDQRVLVTGGAGFVGGNISVALAARHPDWEVIALDNLRRRGAELNLPRLDEAGVTFVRGDVRDPADLEVGPVDAIVECSAEPSVLAGTTGSPDYLVRTNLFGAYHCLEVARRHGARLVFLSTSRVYPVARLERLSLEETETRFELAPDQPEAGASQDGVSEDFSLDGARTLYGTTKLAAEHLIEEYATGYGLSAVVNRCGVIAGPWQMGKVDQGVFTYWMLAHYFGRDLTYIGYGGSGKQVRDLLHVDDLVELVDEQLNEPERWRGAIVNVGGGRPCSLSLREATDICADLTGRRVSVSPAPGPRAGDVPIYLSDCRRLERLSDWRPTRDAAAVMESILDWISSNESTVKRALDP